MQGTQGHSQEIKGTEGGELTRQKRERMVLDRNTENELTMQAGKKWKQCHEDPELQISEVEEISRDWSQFYK